MKSEEECRLRGIKQVRLSPALVVAVVALVAALGGGAVAGVAVNALNEKQIRKVRDIARKQDRKQLRKVRQIAGNKASQAVEGIEAGPKGDRGPEGPPGVRGPEGEIGVQGPPGPSTGPAGGDLAGNYPDPAIADQAVTAAAVAPDSLGGGQINESSLVGFDVSSGEIGSFSINQGPGSAGTGIAAGLDLFFRCTGTPGDVGFEMDFENNGASSATLYVNSITGGEVAQTSRSFILGGDAASALDIPESTTADLVHWITIFFPRLRLTERWIVRTRAFGSNSCRGERFRTVASG